MSLLRLPKIKSVGSAWDRLWDSFSSEKRSLGDRKNRRLRIDPLEERALLSVSAANIESQLVTSPTAVITSMATATDDDGDTIVVWAQSDTVVDADGNTVVNPITGGAMTDSNIYARYYTNEVQQISLPEGVLKDIESGKYATLSLGFGGNEVQELAFSMATASGSLSDWSMISGTFKLNYTAQDGTVYTTEAIQFDESLYGQSWTSTLTEGVDDTATILNVASAKSLNASDCIVAVGDEHMRLVSVSNNQLRVERGVDGTTATAHAAGDLVTLLSGDPSAAIQDALRALGATNGLNELTDITVEATDSRHYAISFGNYSNGLNMNQLFVSDAVWDTGSSLFTTSLPAATMSTVSEPFTVSGIKISPTNPNATAQSIVDAFKQYYDYYLMATVDNDEMPSSYVDTVSAAVPTVTATSVKTADDPNGLRTFNIEFVGATALTNVPDLTIASLKDESGNTIAASSAPVTTIKEPGEIFRVNPEEPDNPFTQLPDKYDQYAPDVSMDADGDFVIVWESEVPNAENNGSVEDIFGRIFTTCGVVDASAAGIMMVDMDLDGVPETQIQGVRALEVASPYSATLPDSCLSKVESDAYTFRVNTITTNTQDEPSVAMDAYGSFVVSWTDNGQETSYFHNIYSRQFEADGTPATSVETMVNSINTDDHDMSITAMSDDGHYVVVWEEGPVIVAEYYDPAGNVLKSQWVVEAGTSETPAFGPSACFDSANNFVIGWSRSKVDKDTSGLTSTGVFFREYNVTGTQIRDKTRANSAGTLPTAVGNADTTTIWPGLQTNVQVMMDIDGDLTVTYDGFGPDVAQYTSVYEGLEEQLALPENADLLVLWPELAYISLPFYSYSSFTSYTNSNGDVDSEIEDVLIEAQGTHGFSDEQLGRLSAILNNVATLLRGDSTGVMFSQFDSDPTLGAQWVLNSDNIVNSQRDGVNTRYIITLSKSLTAGAFVVKISDLETGLNNKAVTITPVYTGDPVVIDAAKTVDAIDNALQAALGVNWPEDDYLGSVYVRLVSADEVAARDGTYWAFDGVDTDAQYVYEVTFIGEAHDSDITVALDSSSLKIKDADGPAPGILLFTEGDSGTEQYESSIGMTNEGDFIVTYLQDNIDSSGWTTNQSIYFRTFDEATNTAGPRPTNATLADGQSILDGGVTVDKAVSYIVVSVSEEMYDNATHTGNAATNPANYVLRDSAGNAIKGGISAVYYGLSEAASLAGMGYSGLNATPSGKYEIVIAVDANGTAAGTTALGTGTYTIELLTPVAATTTNPSGTSGLTDLGSKGLGYSGYSDNGLNYDLTFTLNVTGDTGTKVGAEVPVNQVTDGVQTTSSTEADDLQFSSRCVATDDDGDYVVVWISQGDQDGDGAGVFMRLYDSEGNARSGEIQVNTFTAGDQTGCSVAMDADGDFVVVWASQAQDTDGSWGVYGQRFNSVGTKVGGEFQVNTNIIGDQIDPSVAMNSDGAFVITWTSTEKAGSNFYNTVRAQAYDADGVKTSAEVAINSTTMTDVSEAHSQVALSDAGYFVVVWSSPTNIVNGIVLDTQVLGRMFNIYGTAATAEFTVSAGGAGGSTTDTSLRSGTNAQVAMNRATGAFIVTWQSYTGAAGYDVFFSMYDAQGAATVSARQANLAAPAGNNATLYSGDQINPSVSIDANGNFAITWNGNGAETNPLNSADITSVANGDTQGVWIHKYSNTGTALDTQRRVNLTSVGYQGLSSVAMTASGDYVVAWYGRGSGDKQGIFSRVYNETSDMAGPTVTDFLLPDGTPVDESGQVLQELYAVIVTFDEALDAVTATNVNNYALMIDGVVVVGGISQAYYGLDAAYTLNGQYGINATLTNKYQVVLIVDANGASEGVKALTDGQYQILVKNNVRDAAGNPLNSTGSTVNGGVISDVIYVKVPTGQETCVSNNGNDPDGGQHTYDSTADAVASDADGDYVVAWTDTTVDTAGVWAQLYNQTVTVNADGTRTTSVAVTKTIRVSSDTTATDISVAMDADGDFVVTWSAQNATTSWDVYAQMFDAAGTATSSIFMANTYTKGVQRESAVAMDSDGDFIVTWQSLDQDGSGYGVYAQRYSPTGELVAGTDEVQQMIFSASFTGTFKISWDDDGNPATADKVTSKITYSGNAFSTAAAVQAALRAIGADVTVTATSMTTLKITFKDTDGSRDQSLVWVSAANVTAKTGDPAAAVSTKTVIDGATGEFRVNDTTAGNQMYADVAMSDDGSFVVTWTSYGQDDDVATDGNIYAKTFMSTVEEGFDITLQFSGGLTQSQMDVFVEAAKRWESIIIGDVPDVMTTIGFIDDVLIDASGVAIDGEGGILGQAAPLGLRTGTFIPFYGMMQFDTADLASMEADGSLVDVITHEMAHVLGFGTIWTDLNLLTGEGTADPEFVGENAIAEYDKAFKLTATGVPVENTGGQGTQDSHWRESVFDNELMTGWLNAGVNPLSRMTAASMEDLGYEVNLDAADTYPLSSIIGSDQEGGVVNHNDILNMPRQYVDAKASATGSGTVEYLVNFDDTISDQYYLDNESGDQSHSSVALDADGDFVIAWTGYGHDLIGNGYGPGVEGENGVFARRYAQGGVPASAVFQVNDTSEGNQQDATVAMDADGDFVVTWESNTDGANYDIYAQFYVNNKDADYYIGVFEDYPYYPVAMNPLYGMNGEIGGEIRVNTTTNGDQRFPSVSMDDTGDVVIVWSGNGEVSGQDDDQGVFFQRFAKATDDAGPIVTEVQSVVTTGVVDEVYDGIDIDASVTKFVVSFSEDVTTVDVTNVNNWSLTLNGEVLAGAIGKVQYGLNMAYTLGLVSKPSGNYEAVVTFDSSSSVADYQSLGKGTYKLTLSDAVKDLTGNKLDGDYDGEAGDNYAIEFTILGGGTITTGDDGDSGNDPTPTDPDGDSSDTDVTPSETGPQDSPAVASDADGNYVVVWVQHDTVEGKTELDVYAQLFDNSGTATSKVILVNTYTDGDQIEPDVAMDDYGNFVVVWSGAGEGDKTGIYATVYDKFGTVVNADILVNATMANVQTEPSVAMDSDGDFVVTWTSYNLSVDGNTGVFGRCFNVQGAATSAEFLVNTTTANRQDHSDVEMDDNGNFVVAWESDQQDGNSDGIFGQRFTAGGVKAGSEFQVNTYTLNGQIEPAVAMDADGDFVVTWSSFGQDGSGYGVYARRYNSSGVAKTAAEFRVNTTTLNYQVTPDVAMSDSGVFTITWSTFGQDNVKVAVPTSDYGIYARIFNADGTSYKNAATGNATGEFRVNASTKGNQITPAITVSDGGQIVVAWVGPAKSAASPATTTDTDIYSRIITPGSEASDPLLLASPTLLADTVGEGGSSNKNAILESTDGLTLTWVAKSANGIASQTVTIDGQSVGTVKAATSPYFYCSIGTWAVGTHDYTITTIDSKGISNSGSGSFTVAASTTTTTTTGPTIVGQAVGDTGSTKNNKLETTDKLSITWVAKSANGIASQIVKVDGKKVGTAKAATSPYYYCSIGSWAAGTHDYTITTTDSKGASTTVSGSFTVLGSTTTTTTTGPTVIGQAVGEGGSSKNSKLETTDNLSITWVAKSANGIASQIVNVDGRKVGTAKAATSPYFYCSIGSWAVGTHNYTIKTIDSKGLSTTVYGSFTVFAASSNTNNAARNAVFAAAASDTTSSAKLAWLYD